MRKFLPVLMLAAFVLAGIAYLVHRYPMSEKKAEEFTGFFSDINPVTITTDYEGAKVDLEELREGCRRRDCIPSIDNPEFESAGVADAWLNDEDMIFGLVYKEVERAYPQRILNWHEIVNDQVAGETVAMTYCPLCGTAVSFIRKVDGEEAEFGVSGYLHNSCLVMYDRVEGTLWEQITFEAIVGPSARRDEKLEILNTVTTTWGDWKEAHPNSEVLVRPLDTGNDYSQHPYGAYEEHGEMSFGVKNTDKRLHPKEVIYGVVVNSSPTAYTKKKLELQRVIEDTVGGITVLVEYSKDGAVTITNKSTGEKYIPQRSFWFAWAVFNPGTDLY